MPTDDEDLAALRLATTDLADALAGIDDQWTLPTPCAAWNLRDLVDHVVGGNWYTVRILAGDPSEEALATTMARFSGDPVPVAATVESAVDQQDAFEQPGILDRTWSHVVGELTGRQILRLRLHDLIIHTWDINEARRPPASIPMALAGWGLGELERPESLMGHHVDRPRTTDDLPRSEDPAEAYLQAFGRTT